MKLFEYAIKFLGNFVAGDLPGLSYRSETKNCQQQRGALGTQAIK